MYAINRRFSGSMYAALRCTASPDTTYILPGSCKPSVFQPYKCPHYINSDYHNAVYDKEHTKAPVSDLENNRYSCEFKQCHHHHKADDVCDIRTPLISVISACDKISCHIRSISQKQKQTYYFEYHIKYQTHIFYLCVLL